MAREKKYDLIPASTLNKIKKELEEIGDEDASLKKIERELKELSKKVEKSIEINVELQEKVAELMIYLTKLIEIIEKTPKKHVKGSGDELHVLAEQNKELTDTLKSLEEQLKKEELREAIRRAVNKVGAIK